MGYEGWVYEDDFIHVGRVEFDGLAKLRNKWDRHLPVRKTPKERNRGR